MVGIGCVLSDGARMYEYYINTLSIFFMPLCILVFCSTFLQVLLNYRYVSQ